MKSLLCFAQGHEGAWEAICLDLDIAVQGTSFVDVQTALKSAVTSYIQDAAGEEPDTSRRLLTRAAPWHVRTKYLTNFFITTMFRPDDEYRHAYNMYCAA